MNHDKVSPSIALWVIAAVQFLTPFMLSAIGIALPAIGKEFSATGADLGLISMIYILATALFLLPTGRIADIYGRKKMFLAGIVVMTIATAALGFSQTIKTLIVFRFVQGIGGAMITATSFAILSSIYPPEKRGQAMGIVVSCVYLGISLGPTLAGVVVQYLGWRWIFYAALPIQLLILIFAFSCFKGEWADARGKQFDWAGSIFYMVGLGGIILGSVGNHHISDSPWLLFGGIIAFIFFIFIEIRVPFPLLSLTIIRKNRTFTFSNIATLLNYAASFGVTFFFSLYLQVTKGISPQTAGFILVLQPLIQAAVAPYAGKLSDRYRPAPIATFGMTLCTIGLALTTTLQADSSLVAIFGIQIIMGFGFGLFSTPNTAVIMSSVEKTDYGMASSMLATMRTVGMLTSMTVITVLLGHYLGKREITIETTQEFIKTMHTAMMIFTVTGIGAIFCSFKRTPKSL